jgi:hypothetical protein
MLQNKHIESLNDLYRQSCRFLCGLIMGVCGTITRRECQAYNPRQQ